MTSRTTALTSPARIPQPDAGAPNMANEEACTVFQRTLELAGRRWSGAILYAGVAGARRFVEYRRYVRGISDRLLTQRLRELERQGFITREVVPTMPVQIRYAPTPAGAELVGALLPLGEWGRKHYDVVGASSEV
ncbi:helix-turn-helix domain-containing protein [Promicromonospora sp. NPDC023805]|uniref:winged helix-turn-helix transcriptional regulator n=1 Tax=Promicromonospora sp. NPDC023805 TaxID=3154696 RepID=UPI0034085272